MSTEKLDSIAAKTRVLRNATNITAVEHVLCDLIEALVVEIKEHAGDSSHVHLIGSLPPAMPTGWIGDTAVTPLGGTQHFKEDL